ncbi:restriction endonuclease subunit S [Pseudomonas shahriarae]|uniref:restriction endonuclease subunit S n=1 Tax=Pseudomonas shahriarae TaxID=2745512 RepID=UPI00249BA392|nr:restriction endonuclease subunit S [Pseudomonas shahriarae]MDI3206797.1 restriction endonuclease subunit S [Pseudomonas shahriarae]
MSFPSSWREVNLLDVCEVNPKLSRVDHPPIGTNISFLRPRHIESNTSKGIDYQIQPFGKSFTNGVWFRNNDILIATRGSGTLNCALVANMPTALGIAEHFINLRHGEDLMPEYLVHFVQQPWFQAAAKATNRGTTHQLTIPIQFFRDMKLPLPPINEQRVLVELFKKGSLIPYDTALTRSRELIELLAQALMLAGKQAATWPKQKLSEVCTLNPPRARPREVNPNPNVHFYSASSVHPLSHVATPEKTTTDALSQSCSEVRGLDVLFSTIANSLSGNAAGVVPVQKEVLHFASNAFQILRPSDAILPDYLAAFMRLPWLRDHTESIRGNQGRLSRALFDRIELPLPPIGQQREILDLLSQVPTTLMQDAVEKAKQLAQAMYREGFTGQLSRSWREAYDQVSTLTAPVREPMPIAAPVLVEQYNPVLRTARQTVLAQLSAVQLRVWALLCDRRHPLLIDDPDTVATFCLDLQSDAEITPVALRRTLLQLSALGLIRHTSIPTAQRTFMTAFRRCRVDEFGRAGEDSAHRDAQLVRDAIEASDKGL